MVDIDNVKSKLGNIMDEVSVCEGLILAKKTGEVIIGQTLIPEMNHNAIAEHAMKMLNVDVNATNKGNIIDLIVGLENGSLSIVSKDDVFIVGILGNDGKSSRGLLLRQIKNILK